ncbi:MAG: ribonuclease III [Actinomycetota bacterium]
MVHRSYAYEQPPEVDNERLEFLGDAVLGLVVTDMVYRKYPHLPEGELAKLRAGAVNMASLADIARGIELGEALFLGRGEELSGGREKSSLLADALEAVIGAVYLDQGIRSARKLVEKLTAGYVAGPTERRARRDFKTTLQELAVAEQGILPAYRVSASGPDHAKRFEAEVYVAGRLLGDGGGRSKKEAEQAAARKALSRMLEAADA